MVPRSTVTLGSAEELPIFLLFEAMQPSEQLRQGFVELPVVAGMLGLTPGQRIKLASLVTADRQLAGLRADGTMLLDTALKLCTAAKSR